MSVNDKRERAIILGGGFAGLVAARVLSAFFKEVHVIEKDSRVASESASPKEGNPQTGFAHLLLPFGLRALQQLFPDLPQEFLKNGARKCDLFKELRLVNATVTMPRLPSDFSAYLMTRSLIDKSVRNLVNKIKNVTFLYDTDVKGLLYDYQKNRISGARLQNRINQESSNIYGDFLVDATGPRSLNIKWLEEFGFAAPPIEAVDIEYTQLAYKVRWPEDYSPDWLYTIFRFPDLKKGGYFMKIEDDKQGLPQWLISVVTHFGEPLGKSKDDFERICSQLGDPILYDACKRSTQLSEIIQYKVPKIHRKFFSKMERLPDDFIAIGDAQGIWAPHTGLGLAITILNALELLKAFKSDRMKNVTKRYFCNSEKVVSKYWTAQITQGLLPIIKPTNTSLYIQFLSWYKKKLAKYSVNDPKLWKDLFYFVFSDKPLRSLFRPSVVLRVLIHMIGVK